MALYLGCCGTMSLALTTMRANLARLQAVQFQIQKYISLKRFCTKIRNTVHHPQNTVQCRTPAFPLAWHDRTLLITDDVHLKTHCWAIIPERQWAPRLNLRYSWMPCPPQPREVCLKSPTARYSKSRKCCHPVSSCTLQRSLLYDTPSPRNTAWPSAQNCTAAYTVAILLRDK